MKVFEWKRASGGMSSRRSAFTLIEMMVVVALVGILIGGVFRLLSAAGEGAKRGETIERMQRIENALSGFYAEYGSYPPVRQHGSPNPFVQEDDQGNETKVSTLESENANRAAACQPMAFEFPPMKALDTLIATRYQSEGYYSPNVNPGAFGSGDWPKVKLYRYGVISFLVPRYDAIGEFKIVQDGNKYKPQLINNDTDLAPHEDLYKNHKLWKDVNPEHKAKAQREACARWLPNLQGVIRGGKELMGVNTASQTSEENAWSGRGETPYNQGGNKYFLRSMTVTDGWGNDLYYYSAPPYQSYRLWSAGPDGKTFPADYPLQKLSTADRKTVGNWIKDDVVRPSR